MGYTQATIDLVERHLDGVKSVLEMGSQNIYLNGEENPPFAKDYYTAKGISYRCIDLAGDNGAEQLDLAHIIDFAEKVDLVAAIGTNEHVVKMKSYESVPFHGGYINSIYPIEIESIEEGFYICWLNQHRALKVGGKMIVESPKTQSWPLHGYSYYTEEFYRQLAAATDYDILELFEEAAMGNTIDGWNICAVLKKNSESFPSFEEFKTFDIRRS